jgi:hypothetical protein
MFIQAGPISAFYNNGFLRYLQAGGTEIVRMLYFAVRDSNWNTIPAVIKDEVIELKADSFSIQYTCHFNSPPIAYTGEVKITGAPDGTIHFSFKGKSQSTFLKNRIGFCVLHPIEGIAGTACTIQHPDGTRSVANFPEWVSPHQPFKNIQAMEWSVGKGAFARLHFTGDVFETEDQRNWTDASYKTYCTPLHLPFPVEVSAGAEMEQTITLNIKGDISPTDKSREQVISIVPGSKRQAFAPVGLGMGAEGMRGLNSSPLAGAGFSHLRADVFLSKSDWQQHLEAAFFQGSQLMLPLELVVFLVPNQKKKYITSYFNWKERMPSSTRFPYLKKGAG